MECFTHSLCAVMKFFETNILKVTKISKWKKSTCTLQVCVNRVQIHIKITQEIENIQSFFVKNYGSMLSKPLYILSTQLSALLSFSIWKCARICPTFKTGSYSDIINYPLISITSNFAKVFEFCICICTPVHHNISTWFHAKYNTLSI